MSWIDSVMPLLMSDDSASFTHFSLQYYEIKAMKSNYHTEKHIIHVSAFACIYNILWHWSKENYFFQMFLAITKLVLATKKEQMKKAAEQPAESIKLNSKQSRGGGHKKGCCKVWKLIYLGCEHLHIPSLHEIRWWCQNITEAIHAVGHNTLKGQSFSLSMLFNRKSVVHVVNW